MPRATGRRGQWRYRPGTNVSPATREVGARVQAGTTINGNGITTGKFIQPIMDDGFIFPELNIFGEAQIIYEFELLRHLAQGSGPWLGGLPGSDPNPNGPIAGQLDPWPGAVAPPKATCSQTTPAQTPKANAGSDQAVTSGAVVTLSGRSDTTNIPGKLKISIICAMDSNIDLAPRKYNHVPLGASCWNRANHHIIRRQYQNGNFYCTSQFNNFDIQVDH